jgi:hypothetical protein
MMKRGLSEINNSSLKLKITIPLLNKGYDKRMISRMVYFLNPTSLEIAEKYLKKEKGKWGHPMIKSTDLPFDQCRICFGKKLEHSEHLTENSEVFDNFNNSSLNLLNNDTSILDDSSVMNKLFILDEEDINYTKMQKSKNDKKLKKMLIIKENSLNIKKNHSNDSLDMVDLSGYKNMKQDREHLDVEKELEYLDPKNKIATVVSGIVSSDIGENKTGQRHSNPLFKDVMPNKSILKKTTHYLKGEAHPKYQNMHNFGEHNTKEIFGKMKFKRYNTESEDTLKQININNQNIQNYLPNNINLNIANNINHNPLISVPSPTRRRSRRRTEFRRQKSAVSIKSINKNVVHLSFNINSNSIQCVKCFKCPSNESSYTNPMKQLECMHQMCLNCIKDTIKTNVTLNSIYDIYCPECKKSFSKHFIMSHVHDKIYIAYLKALRDSTNAEDLLMTLNNELVPCAIPECDGFALNPLFKNGKKIENPNSPDSAPARSSRDLRRNRAASNDNNLIGIKSHRLTLNENRKKKPVREKENFFIQCENHHHFCFNCRQRTHPGQACQIGAERISKSMSPNITNMNFNQSSTFIHLKNTFPNNASPTGIRSNKQTNAEINHISNVVSMKQCPNCGNLCEIMNNFTSQSHFDYSNLRTCNFCFQIFCMICMKNETVNHYYNPFKLCFFMYGSNLNSIYIQNVKVKYFRHFFILFLLLLFYPLFFIFSSICFIVFLQFYFYDDFIKKHMLKRIFIKYEMNHSFILYCVMKVPKLLLYPVGLYLFPFFLMINFIFLILMSVLPFFLILKNTYERMIR